MESERHFTIAGVKEQITRLRTLLNGLPHDEEEGLPSGVSAQRQVAREALVKELRIWVVELDRLRRAVR
jgi:hypothetical protein